MDVLSRLLEACPTGVRDAGSDDAVAGVAPSYVARPGSPSEVASVVRAIAPLGLPIVARGAGTKLDWGLPPEAVGVVLDVSSMSSVLEHEVEDLVVRVEAGCRLGELQRVLARSGQRLPVDEVVEGSTVGGVVATGISGPLRHRYGAVRDVLLGVSFVRSDGVLAKSGSKVVKNVAGYDLAKLLTGSYGTLGVLTEVILRVRPVPRHATFVTVKLDDHVALSASLRALSRSSVAPSAVEAYRRGRGPVEVAVLLEGAAPTDERASTVLSLLGPGAAEAERPAWWGRLPGTTTIKLAVPSGTVTNLLAGASEACLGDDLDAVISGSAGTGVLFCGLDSDCEPGSVSLFVAALRQICETNGGTAVVLRAPPEVRAVVDVWGSVRGLDLMRRVKTEFDPERRLSPGRFVGGI